MEQHQQNFPHQHPHSDSNTNSNPGYRNPTSDDGCDDSQHQPLQHDAVRQPNDEFHPRGIQQHQSMHPGMHGGGQVSALEDDGGRGNCKRKRERDIQAKECNKQAQRRFRDRQKDLINGLTTKVRELQHKAEANEDFIKLLMEEQEMLKASVAHGRAGAALSAGGSMQMGLGSHASRF